MGPGHGKFVNTVFNLCVPLEEEFLDHEKTQLLMKSEINYAGPLK
jgi:hypothetical protein